MTAQRGDQRSIARKNPCREEVRHMPALTRRRIPKPKTSASCRGVRTMARASRTARIPMRNSLMHLVVAFGVVMAFWPAGARAQTAEAENLMGATGSGGPAPVHDFNGTWIGPGEP